MRHKCTTRAATQVTLQLHWRQNPTVWCFCERHASMWVPGIVAMKPHWLGIEAWGSYQPELLMEIPTGCCQFHTG